ncbi:hypothetical protein PoB_005646400 [Plakobranchus ocellatus]|uniref:Uncharacterized protein n=1 Tax=Plakobranchus ocellatus TaxID=259542 RepID=A0AAV4CBK6_9GAST|nr:hypothetical protein PoB_005646400 [Plakobranchus ocellatus]
MSTNRSRPIRARERWTYQIQSAVMRGQNKGWRDQLLKRSKERENSSPKLPDEVLTYDEIMGMKEMERIRVNLNRAFSQTMVERWDKIYKMTIAFLKQIIYLNEHISEEADKQAKQLIHLIHTRNKRVAMASKIEQMAGLLMHVTFYRTVLEAKIEEMRTSKASLLVHCTKQLGLLNPREVIDGYFVLKGIFTELWEEVQEKTGLLRASTGSMMEEETSNMNMQLNMQITALFAKLKNLKEEVQTSNDHGLFAIDSVRMRQDGAGKGDNGTGLNKVTYVREGWESKWVD